MYTNDHQSNSVSKPDMVVDTSTSALAKTLLEMGEIYSKYKTQVHGLESTLDYQVRSKLHYAGELEKVSTLLNNSEREVKALHAKMDEYRKEMEKVCGQRNEHKEEITVCHLIIDELLSRYKIKPSDKRRIAQLRKSK